MDAWSLAVADNHPNSHCRGRPDQDTLKCPTAATPARTPNPDCYSRRARIAPPTGLAEPGADEHGTNSPSSAACQRDTRSDNQPQRL